MSAARVVLDSFALLAFLRGERGEEKIAALLERAGIRDEPLHMSEVNYAEVKYIVIRKDGVARWQEIVGELPAMPTLPRGLWPTSPQLWRRSKKPNSSQVIQNSRRSRGKSESHG